MNKTQVVFNFNVITNKNVDIKSSTHGEFLKWPSPDTLKVTE